MNRGCLTRLACILLLVFVILWRMIGAPLDSAGFENVQTALWQARVLLPSRIARILTQWPLSGQIVTGVEQDPALWQWEEDPEAALLQQLTGQAGPALEGPSLTVFDAQTQQMLSMPLESYVCAVVSAEMPASYHMEALKAQAVAARTRVVAQSKWAQGSGCSAHPGADICTQSAHCQGFASATDCQAKWGTEYSVYHARVQEAVNATVGEIITYEGAPITVFYHAISGGVTEDAQTVFAQKLPYMTSVESKGEETARGYSTDTSFSFAEAASLLQKAYPDYAITADTLQQDFAIRDYTPTGRVDTLSLGEHEVKASEVRKALGLRSTWFTLSTDSHTITFHQRGYGHGVGMSQAGANGMAADNADYRAILAHYFQGTAVESLKP